MSHNQLNVPRFIAIQVSEGTTKSREHSAQAEPEKISRMTSTENINSDPDLMVSDGFLDGQLLSDHHFCNRQPMGEPQFLDRKVLSDPELICYNELWGKKPNSTSTLLL